MHLQPVGFDSRQEMQYPDYELQYKQDAYLQNVELHHHDFFELYYLVSGDVTYLIENRICHVLPGDMLLISPRELHQVQIKPEMAIYERYVLWIDPHLIQRLGAPELDLYQGLDPARPEYRNRLRLNPEDQSRIKALMQQLYGETQSEAFGSRQLQACLLTQLLILVNRLVSQPIDQEEEPRTSGAVSQAIRYISGHYAEKITLESLAERFFISKYHLSHEFNRCVGTSVYRYVQKKRLLAARQEIAQGEKPTAVYARCGFGDYTAFYRAFKAEYHISPREYEIAVRNQR